MRSRVKLGRGENAPQVPTIENGLHVLDARDRYSPSLLGKVGFVGMVEGVHATGDVAYVANAFRGVRSIDVRDPDRPALIDTWSTLPRS
jgi:hypothetical protein